MAPKAMPLLAADFMTMMERNSVLKVEAAQNAHKKAFIDAIRNDTEFNECDNAP